jgi:L-alanine-DL-glutamate epimerase-like enolase superfamily enzyme
MSAGRLSISARLERFPLRGSFTISRGSRTEIEVVTAELRDGGHVGRGEAVPYRHYGETPEGVIEAIEAVDTSGLTRETLQRLLPHGAARNAIDCALWDLDAKRSGRRAHELAGLPSLRPLTTAYTISLGDPAKMEADARAVAFRPLLKVKLGGEGDDARIAAVRRAAPDSALIVDANEAWREKNVEALLAACAAAQVKLIEQPLPAGRDQMLAEIARPIPVCADESVHDRADLDRLAGLYDAINIKLDKAGGLTEALALAQAARERGFAIMVGCMLGTSLAMAPAVLVAQTAEFVDLDGPLLLARDRAPGLAFEGSVIAPPSPNLWG